MTDFKAKMHQIRFKLGLRPRPRWRNLQRFPRHPIWIFGAASWQGRGYGGEEEGKVEGKGGRGSGGGKGEPPSYC